MNPFELARFLEVTLSRVGLELDEVQDKLSYGHRSAWAIYYRSQDCKLQVFWSERDGGTNFMLAPSAAPNEFGLLNLSNAWHWMLMLSNVEDDLQTPPPEADEKAVMAWLKALLEIHFDSAHEALLRRDLGPRG